MIATKANIDIKQFIGGMDLDSSDETLGKGLVRAARNGIWRGIVPNMRFESIKGTTAVVNPYLPVIGTNVTIKGYYDGATANKRIFIFNANTAGFHGIYIYYTLLDSWQRLLEVGVNTDGDILAFDNYNRVHSVDIIYGDDDSGDLLFFVDALKRPRKLNIQRILAGVYPTVKESYIKVIKAPPVGTPKCVYENDNTVTANNLVNKLFNIACAHIYDDFEESVLGSGAAQPLPSNTFNPQNNTPSTTDARMAIYVPTGDINVKKIRIYGKQVKDGSTSDWFVIDTLIKSDLGITNNTYYRYVFYNNGSYVPASGSIYANNNPADGQLDQDYVPLNANAQTLLNGNVVAYGGLTEGYDFLNPSLGITPLNTMYPQFSANGLLFFAAPNGVFTGSQPQVTMYLTGVGVNDGLGNVTDLFKAPALLEVNAKSDGLGIGFNFTNGGGVNNVPTLLATLRSAAEAAGWIFVSNGSNSLTMYYPTGDVVVQSSFYQGVSADTSNATPPISCHYPEANYSYGVLYRDIDGRTNGVISNVTGDIRTLQRVEGQIPLIGLGLAGFTPPLWASYYEVVRTDNLTYDKRLDWVSASAFSNIGTLVVNQYAFLGIENISYYNTQINATEGVISYGFTQGDRVRILGRYSASGTFVALNYDYAILGVQNEINVNGVNQAGTYLQIAYPTADVAADPNLKFDGTDDYQNYKILIYSYKAYSKDNQNVYWQIGQQYGIGNPGTISAYHMGNIADNQVQLTDGDVFYRQRTVPIVNTFYMPMGSYEQGDHYMTIWSYEGGTNPLNDNGIWNVGGDIQRPAALDFGSYPFPSSAGWIVQNKSSDQFSVRFRGTITAIEKTDPNGSFGLYAKVVTSTAASVYNVVSEHPGLKVGDTNLYEYDITVPVPPGGKVWLVDHVRLDMLIGGGPLRIDIIRNRTINVFDPSFSDIFSLQTNSDNKPNIIQTTAKQTYYNTKYRWGQAYQLGTEINNSNRFFPLDFDEIDKSAGAIQRLYAWKRELRFFQELRVGHTGVYAKFIKDNNGDNSLVTTDDIISKNNVEYFEGIFGIGNQPCSLIGSGFQNYFVDPAKGRVLRLSLDGIKDISEEFRILSLAGVELPNYLNPYNYQFSGIAHVIGCYNYNNDREGEAIFCLQPGVNNNLNFVGPDDTILTQPSRFFSGPTTLNGFTISFNEKNNLFPVFYDFKPDELVCAENTLYSFYNGAMYVHDNTTAYANFYNTQYYPSLDIIFNDQEPKKKKYLTIGYQSYKSKIWAAPTIGDIYTSGVNEQTGFQQISQLIQRDFSLSEKNVYAAFLRDYNSGSNGPVALLEGDYLEGNYIRIKLTAPDEKFNFIYQPFVKWIDSPKLF